MLHEYAVSGQSMGHSAEPIHMTDDSVKSPEEIRIREQARELKMMGADVDPRKQPVFGDASSFTNSSQIKDPFMAARSGKAHPMVQADDRHVS